MSRNEARRSRARADIIAAVRLLADEGNYTPSVVEIANKAGYSYGLLHYYFADLLSLRMAALTDAHIAVLDERLMAMPVRERAKIALKGMS